MDPFERALKRLLGVEGEYADHRDDSGGATRWGVTEYLARAHGYYGEMREYPLERAIQVYRLEYWSPLALTPIAYMHFEIAYEIFEASVQTPPGTAAVWLQRLLNVYNRRETDYADVVVDGRIGERTLTALGRFLRHRGPEGADVMVVSLNALQAVYLISLAERRQKDETFVYGWIKERVVARPAALEA